MTVQLKYPEGVRACNGTQSITLVNTRPLSLHQNPPRSERCPNLHLALNELLNIPYGFLGVLIIELEPWNLLGGYYVSLPAAWRSWWRSRQARKKTHPSTVVHLSIRNARSTSTSSLDLGCISESG